MINIERNWWTALDHNLLFNPKQTNRKQQINVNGAIKVII